MADWLNIPRMEERIKAADAQPPSIDLVIELTNELALALGKNVTLDHQVWENGAILWSGLDNKRNASLYVESGRYVLTEYFGKEYFESQTKSAEKVVWKLCGYPHLPAEWRKVAKRAKKDGYHGDFIPVTYFISRTRWWRWRLEKIWPGLADVFHFFGRRAG